MKSEDAIEDMSATVRGPGPIGYTSTYVIPLGCLVRAATARGPERHAMFERGSRTRDEPIRPSSRTARPEPAEPHPRS